MAYSFWAGINVDLQVAIEGNLFYIHHRLRDRMFGYRKMYKKMCVFFSRSKSDCTGSYQIGLAFEYYTVGVDTIATMVGRRSYWNFHFSLFIESSYESYIFIVGGIEK